MSKKNLTKQELNQKLLSLVVSREQQAIEEVKKLLIEGANVNALDIEGNTPLILAIRAGMGPIGSLLLKYEADVNKANKAGHTALHYAYHIAVVEVLVSHGANIHAKDKFDLKPIAVKSKEIHNFLRDVMILDAEFFPTPDSAGWPSFKFTGNQSSFEYELPISTDEFGLERVISTKIIPAKTIKIFINNKLNYIDNLEILEEFQDAISKLNKFANLIQYKKDYVE